MPNGWESMIDVYR